MLLVLLAAAWLTYPLAGIADVRASVAEKKRPPGSGFSFLPELIVFPASFLGVSWLIDWIAKPWGRNLVGSLCLVMAIHHLFVLVRRLMKIGRLNRSAA